MRKTLIGTSVVLGLGLALAPVAANAATPAPAPVTAQQAILPNAVDQMDYGQQLDAFSGNLTQDVRVKGLAGAQITYSVNGVAQTKKANARGVAKFTVTFVQASNAVSVSQTKGGQSSSTSSYEYDFTR